jgi:hypothetical protein
MVVLWSKFEVKRDPESCEKLGQSWGSKVAEIWVKNCAGQNFRPCSGPVPEIAEICPGAYCKGNYDFRKLGGSWAELPLGRKYRLIWPELPVWGISARKLFGNWEIFLCCARWELGKLARAGVMRGGCAEIGRRQRGSARGERGARVSERQGVPGGRARWMAIDAEAWRACGGLLDAEQRAAVAWACWSAVGGPGHRRTRAHAGGGPRRVARTGRSSCCCAGGVRGVLVRGSGAASCRWGWARSGQGPGGGGCWRGWMRGRGGGRRWPR